MKFEVTFNKWKVTATCCIYMDDLSFIAAQHLPDLLQFSGHHRNICWAKIYSSI